MKFRIDGMVGGNPEWIEWDDGLVTGSGRAMEWLSINDAVLEKNGEAVFSFEDMTVDNPLAPQRFRNPFYVFHLCNDGLYGLPPVFDFGSANADMAEIIAAQPKRPDGAV